MYCSECAHTHAQTLPTHAVDNDRICWRVTLVVAPLLTVFAPDSTLNVIKYHLGFQLSGNTDDKTG